MIRRGRNNAIIPHRIGRKFGHFLFLACNRIEIKSDVSGTRL